MSEVGLIILAAGASKRMGQPKALLSWGTKNVITHQSETALSLGLPVGVLLGANAVAIEKTIAHLPVTSYFNPLWKNGMGASLAFATKAILKTYPSLNGLLFLAVDQPLVNRKHLERMLTVFKPNQKQIIVSESEGGWRGIPVLFDSFYFDALKQLTGDEGAKGLTHKHKNQVKLVPAKDLLTDMDTPESYAALKEKINRQ